AVGGFVEHIFTVQTRDRAHVGSFVVIHGGVTDVGGGALGQVVGVGDGPGVDILIVATVVELILGLSVAQQDRARCANRHADVEVRDGDVCTVVETVRAGVADVGVAQVDVHEAEVVTGTNHPLFGVFDRGNTQPFIVTTFGEVVGHSGFQASVLVAGTDTVAGAEIAVAVSISLVLVFAEGVDGLDVKATEARGLVVDGVVPAARSTVEDAGGAEFAQRVEG